MKPASNCSVVPGMAIGGRPIFSLNLLFLSKTDSSFYVIAIYAVITVQLNGTGRAGICMTLPDFEGEELDI